MSKELANVINEETLALLAESYPVEQNNYKIILPRLGFISQDKTEGKGKAMKVVAEAGVFFFEVQSDEEVDGVKKWNKTEIGTEVEGIILFARKQLRMYDSKTEKFTSSPVYDSDSEVVPLFCDKVEVGRGTPKELQAQYEYLDENGKTRSRLEETRVLYIKVADTVYQLNLRGSSMYSFLTYSRKTLPPSVITVLNSEAKEKGTIQWNQITFTEKRKLTQDEAVGIVAEVQDIKNTIASEKAQYVTPTVSAEYIEAKQKADKAF